MIIFPRSKQGKAKVFILCDVIFWWGCQMGFVTLGSDKVNVHILKGPHELRTADGNTLHCQRKSGVLSVRAPLRCKLPSPFRFIFHHFINVPCSRINLPSSRQCRLIFFFCCTFVSGLCWSNSEGRLRITKPMCRHCTEPAYSFLFFCFCFCFFGSPLLQ